MNELLGAMERAVLRARTRFQLLDKNKKIAVVAFVSIFALTFFF